MMQPDAALLFAAGLGTRMAPLTDTCPKPLIEVAGKPLLDHARDIIRDAGLTRVVVNTHYLADQIEDHLAGTGVLISYEQSQVLETGGGLKHALPLLQSDPVVTMNTDAVWTGQNPLFSLRDAWDANLMEALLLLVPKERAVGHAGKGDFLLAEDGRITPGPGPVYTGLQIIRTDRLASYPDGPFSMWEIWRDMLDRGTLFGTLHLSGWCDVGRPDSIALAEHLIKADT